MSDQTRNAIGIVAGLLEARTGQKLTADRLWRVGSALSGVLREQGLETVEDLADRLARPGQSELARQVVEALLNNETYFFRDRAMFDQLSLQVLPELARLREGKRKLSIWSVGCSTGQEAYSIAMLFAEQRARWRGWKIEILGTDVAGSVISSAREGSFSQFQIQRGLSVAQMVSFFEETRTGWRAGDVLRSTVRFETHSVLDTPPEPGRFDLILCRNVLLYFDRDTRQRAFDRLAMALAPDGCLMLGAGETTVGQTERFAPQPRMTGFHRLAMPIPVAPLAARAGALR
ncbi:MAG TPA: CheR family methyltransferase [Croceibacterium sp.]|nr:CheR family methyltransferase [Croceibacterium sp.]